MASIIPVPGAIRPEPKKLKLVRLQATANPTKSTITNPVPAMFSRTSAGTGSSFAIGVALSRLKFSIRDRAFSGSPKSCSALTVPADCSQAGRAIKARFPVSKSKWRRAAPAASRKRFSNVNMFHIKPLAMPAPAGEGTKFMICPLYGIATGLRQRGT